MWNEKIRRIRRCSNDGSSTWIELDLWLLRRTRKERNTSESYWEVGWNYTWGKKREKWRSQCQKKKGKIKFKRWPKGQKNNWQKNKQNQKSKRSYTFKRQRHLLWSWRLLTWSPSSQPWCQEDPCPCKGSNYSKWRIYNLVFLWSIRKSVGCWQLWKIYGGNLRRWRVWVGMGECLWAWWNSWWITTNKHRHRLLNGYLCLSWC